MRARGATALIGLSFLIAIVPGVHVRAEAVSTTIRARDLLIAQLVARHDADLIRSNRLADDTTLALIMQYEGKLKSFAQQVQALKASASGERTARLRLEVQLAGARSDYAAATQRALAADKAYAAQRAGYLADTRSIVANASPEKLELLQRFADGDHSVYPRLSEIADADVKAMQIQADAGMAVIRRQQASQAMQMFDDGEVSVDEPLKHFKEAAGYDPTDFSTWISIAELERDKANTAEALDALAKAKGAAGTPWETVIAQQMIAEIAISEGKFDQGLATLHDAQASLLAMMKQGEFDSSIAYAVPRNLVAQGDAELRLGKVDGARASYIAARDWAATIRQKLPNEWLSAVTYGLTLHKLGDLAGREGKPMDAVALYREALSVLRAATGDGKGLEKNMDMAAALQRLGLGLSDLHQYSAARAAYREGLDHIRPLATRDDSNLDLKMREEGLITELALSELHLDDRVGAARDFDDAIATIKRILETATVKRSLLADLDAATQGRAEVYVAEGKLDLAIASYRESLDTARKLVADSPHDTGAQAGLVLTLDRLSDALNTRGSNDDILEAYKLLTEGLRIGGALATNDPSNATMFFETQKLTRRMIRMQLGVGDLDDANWLADDLLMVARARIKASPDDPLALDDLRLSLASRAEISAAMGKASDAEDTFKELDGITTRMAQGSPDGARLQAELGQVRKLVDLLGKLPAPHQR